MEQKEKVYKRKIGPIAMDSKNKHCNLMNNRGTGNWSNLPEDILGKIMSKQNFQERLRMTAVCKGWRIPIHGTNPLNVDGVPWLLWYPNLIDSKTLNQIKLYEPGNPNPYSIGNDFSHKGGNKLLGARVCASKFGWVVLWKHISGTCSFFLYSPFAANIVQLPNLPEMQLHYGLFTFSNVPTSHDCIFFLLNQKSMKEILLYTFHNGERTWKSHACVGALCGCNDHWVYSYKSYKNIVYLDGILYCLFSCGEEHKLATFNVSEQEWSVRTTLVISTFGGNACVKMLESDKGLLALYKMAHYGSDCRILKHDLSENDLIKIRSLEDHTLFVDWQSAFSTEAHGEENVKCSNRIYCNDGSALRYLSMEDGKIHIDPITCKLSPLSNGNILFLDISRLDHKFRMRKYCCFIYLVPATIITSYL